MKPLVASIEFHDVDETPIMPPGESLSSALLYNQCDGYHLVFARFTRETGEFEGFFDFMGDSPYPNDFFCAWALLPDTVKELYPVFARKGPAT
jgi:hypothetical protein